MGVLSVRAATSRCHSPSGCMQWDSKYKTYTHTLNSSRYEHVTALSPTLSANAGTGDSGLGGPAAHAAAADKPDASRGSANAGPAARMQLPSRRGPPGTAVPRRQRQHAQALRARASAGRPRYQPSPSSIGRNRGKSRRKNSRKNSRNRGMGSPRCEAGLARRLARTRLCGGLGRVHNSPRDCCPPVPSLAPPSARWEPAREKGSHGARVGRCAGAGASRGTGGQATSTGRTAGRDAGPRRHRGHLQEAAAAAATAAAVDIVVRGRQAVGRRRHARVGADQGRSAPFPSAPHRPATDARQHRTSIRAAARRRSRAPTMRSSPSSE